MRKTSFKAVCIHEISLNHRHAVLSCLDWRLFFGFPQFKRFKAAFFWAEERKTRWQKRSRWSGIAHRCSEFVLAQGDGGRRLDENFYLSEKVKQNSRQSRTFRPDRTAYGTIKSSTHADRNYFFGSNVLGLAKPLMSSRGENPILLIEFPFDTRKAYPLKVFGFLSCQTSDVLERAAD